MAIMSIMYKINGATSYVMYYYSSVEVNVVLKINNVLSL